MRIEKKELYRSKSFTWWSCLIGLFKNLAGGNGQRPGAQAKTPGEWLGRRFE